MSLARGLADLRAENGAREFEITLATQTPREDFDDSALPFPVVRQPGFWRLMRLVRSADVVHLAGPSFLVMLLSWFLGKPFVIEHHGYQAICPNGVLIHQPERSVCPGHFQAGNYAECWKCQSAEVSKMRSLVHVLAAFPRNALARRAARNFAISEHVRRRLTLPRTCVVQYGIDTAPEGATSLSPGDLPSSKKVCFAFVGRFVPEKGISVLVEALANLRRHQLEFEAKLIGDGPERPKIQSEIAAAQLDSSVKITGYVSGAALAEVIADVSVVVMPSIWEETAGLAAMEQMMRGRLVVCADIGGLTEIVGDAGLKFPAGNATALAACLRRVIENPRLVEEFGAKARNRAWEQFTRSRMIDEHAAIYRNIWTKPNK